MTITTPARTAKAPAARKPRASAAATAEAGADDAPSAAAAGAEAPMVRQKDFLARVIARSGAKKKDARVIVEATLAELTQALNRGESLNLPGLGRAQVNRQRDTPGGGVLMVKLKPGAGRAAAKQPAEDDAEGLAEGAE